LKPSIKFYGVVSETRHEDGSTEADGKVGMNSLISFQGMHGTIHLFTRNWYKEVAQNSTQFLCST